MPPALARPISTSFSEICGDGSSRPSILPWTRTSMPASRLASFSNSAR